MRKRGSALSTLAAAAFALVLSAGAEAQRDPTPQSEAGPMEPDDAPATAMLWRDGDPGERLHLRGRVVSTSGEPLYGAELMVWQADGTGSYRDDRYRARIVTGEDGSFQMVTVLPGQYWGAKHIHVRLSHPEHLGLTTRILFRGDPNIDATEGELAIPLEEVRTEDRTILLGGVEFVLEPYVVR